MVVSILAVVFLIVIGSIAFFGYRTFIRGAPSADDQRFDKCAICRRRLAKTELIMREIGDYKLLWFCRECVLKLYADLGITN